MDDHRSRTIDDILLDQAEKCDNSGMGISCEIHYFQGRSQPHGDPLDVAFNVKWKPRAAGSLRCYGLFSGFNGSARHAITAANSMFYQLALNNESSISADDDDETIFSYLEDAFDAAKRDVNHDIKNKQSQKKILEISQEGQQSEYKEKIDELDIDIKAGTTVLTALIIERRLYVLNCGNSRLLLVTSENNKPCCDALIDVHDFKNKMDATRVTNAGLEITHEMHNMSSRGIGDPQHQKDFAEPGNGYLTQEPDVFQYKIEPNWQYLILLSTGVVKCVKECMQRREEREISEREVNNQIMEYVLHETKNSFSHSYTSKAQATVDLIGRIHFESFNRGELRTRVRDGMSLILVDLTNPTATEYPVSQLETQLSLQEIQSEILPYADMNDFESRVTEDSIHELLDLNLFERSDLLP